MLHVEHRHVLVNHHFEPRGRHGADQVEQLIAVQIVRAVTRRGARGRRYSTVNSLVGVEREVGDHAASPCSRIEREARQIADQDAVGPVFASTRKMPISSGF